MTHPSSASSALVGRGLQVGETFAITLCTALPGIARGMKKVDGQRHPGGYTR